jgi:N-acyl-phosphatidylethanolamine-hydrolysing phospholipase D
VKVHKEINAKKSVGVHWGTFPLGNEHFTAARRDLEEAKEEERIKG